MTHRQRYSAARFLAPEVEAPRFRKTARVDGTFEHDWPAELAEVLEADGKRIFRSGFPKYLPPQIPQAAS